MYVSPATQSISIVTNGGTPFIANLTPQSPGCSGTPLTCRVSAPVPPGQDTFVLTMYDATGASGKALSTATTSAQITVGQANSVSVTMNGIIASFNLSLNPNSSHRGQSVQSTVTVQGLDADGYQIAVPGAYNNPISISDSDTSGHTSLSSSSISSPSVSSVTLSYDGGAIQSATITASATGATSRSATFTVTLNPITVNPNTLTFNATGVSYAQTFAASEAGYSGTFTSSNCVDGSSNTDATVSTTDNVNFSVTPTQAGTCTITVQDTNGQSAQVPTTVTTTSFGVQ
jgi:hypothetical protein